MRKDLKQLYDRLTPGERVNLVLEAIGRQDLVEAERLSSSCPYKVYKIKDPDFSDKLTACQEVVMLFTMMFRDAWLKTRIYDTALIAFKLAVSGLDEGLQLGLAKATGIAPTENDPMLKSEALSEAYTAYTKNMYQGFLLFCEKVGMDPNRLLGCYPPILEDVEAAKDYLNKETPPDLEQVEYFCELFCLAWPDAEEDKPATLLEEDRSNVISYSITPTWKMKE